jgi:5-methylcytosine-specific restriction endonuclease McrA
MSAEFNLQFLRRFQRLLDEGDFSATYKFALLRALADLSVEKPLEAGGSLTVSVYEIAEKFIEYYWRQARPYRDSLLFQSGKGQAEVITKIVNHQQTASQSMAEAKADRRRWESLVRQVARNVERDPLRRLQTLPARADDFLYAQPPERATVPPHEVRIRLRPGVAAAFQDFHPLVISLLEAAWIQRIVTIRSNGEVLADSDQLGEFLFGSERQALDGYRDVLLDIHGAACFYCEKRLQNRGNVDHFIAWARYPTDLGHNFVLSCRPCNESKYSHLPSVDLLRQWRAANLDKADVLAAEFQRRKLPHNQIRTRRVAQWAYEQAELSGIDTWDGRGRFLPLRGNWRNALGVPAMLKAAEDGGEYL